MMILRIFHVFAAVKQKGPKEALTFHLCSLALRHRSELCSSLSMSLRLCCSGTCSSVSRWPELCTTAHSDTPAASQVIRKSSLVNFGRLTIATTIALLSEQTFRASHRHYGNCFRGMRVTLMLLRESNMTNLVLDTICSTMDFSTPLASFSLRESVSKQRSNSLISGNEPESEQPVEALD